MSKLSPEQQAVQIVSTWKAIDEAQRTDGLLRYYIVLAIKDALRDADHCSPEERAVIDAAECRFNDNDEGQPTILTLYALDIAVNTLLAARAKKETM